MNDIKIAITVPGHGHFSTTAYGLDRTIATYLPTCLADLRRYVSERTECDYSDVHEVSTMLVILADIDAV